MLYIEIPENMKFACIKNGDGQSEDHFVDSRDESELSLDEELLAPISILQAVREFLQIPKKILGSNGNKMEVNGLTIHKKWKPVGIDYLEYRAERNGLDPTTHAVVSSRPKPAKVSAGQCWYQLTYLSLEKRAEIEEKRRQQKANRQHWGDSPLAT